MLKGRTLLAVVPARGGSKEVPLKNIHPLQGIPLIGHAGAIVQELGYFDRAIVSTDHPEIAAVARAYGLDAPFMRPEALSGDWIGDHPVLHHALTEMERLDGRRYDILVMLQPTSPLRKAAHVTAAVTTLIEGGWDAAGTVSKTNSRYHPLKQLTVASDGSLEYYDPRGRTVVARQQLTPVYHRNGAAYAVTRECLLTQQLIKGKCAAAVIINEPMVSIDTLEDFEAVEALMHSSGSVSAELKRERGTS